MDELNRAHASEREPVVRLGGPSHLFPQLLPVGQPGGVGGNGYRAGEAIEFVDRTSATRQTGRNAFRFATR